MEWQDPKWLYLILPLALGWLLLSLDSRRRRRRAAEAFVAQAMWTRILPADSPGRFWAKLLLRETALVAGLIALAGPRFGAQTEVVIPRGSDLYVLIDVSRSMLAEDVPPSRLGRAKADVAALVNRLDGERVGLVAFAGQAVVKCPLTVDYDAFRRALDELDPGSAPRGGTAIGDAIRKALEVFQSRGARDQAILLITDGDDQQSYPLEAAEAAAERHVTIFTIGLGDDSQGARIPQQAQAKSYLEYEGQQVWSKLDGSLLKSIALKTSGVYVPVGTKSYDLGELYTKYLQGRRGGAEEARKRIRRADQFQIFLALAILALLADAMTRPYRDRGEAPTATDESKAGGQGTAKGRGTRHAAVTATLVLTFLSAFAVEGRADEGSDAIRDGLKHYNSGEYDKARDRFSSAREKFHSLDDAKAAIAAFDQACASHRKGDFAQAREWYLKAGLAHDRTLAASAHYNLGTLAAEDARRLAGDKPDDVAADKRPQILEQLAGAVTSFRHSLELEPNNARARRDIELVRRWMKYYTERWRERDREKRRQETNLVAFLEYLTDAERALRDSVAALPATASSDAFAEPKRLQDELQGEIGPLKEKIAAELKAGASGGGPGGGAGNAPQGTSKELEKGIALLQGWATAAGEKMLGASRKLDERQAGPATDDQKAAIEELEKIWEAVIPFPALLARDLADQTKITQALAPAEPPADAKAAAGAAPAPSAPPDNKDEPEKAATTPSATTPTLGTEGEDLAPLAELQERTKRRTQLLKLKAEAGLAQPDPPKPPAGGPAPKPADANGATPQPVDPEQIKAGYQKAVELAPKAVEQMERASKSLQQKDRPAAYPPAEEARKILEEIQKAQPKNDQKDQQKKDQDQQKKDQDQQKKDQEKKDQQNKDQQKKDQEKKDQNKDDQQKKDQQKKDKEKKDQEKKDQEKKDQEKKDQQKEDQEKKDEPQKGEQGKPQPQVSKDRIEDALRKVRERQQEKRERDRRLKAYTTGRIPVEKDW